MEAKDQKKESSFISNQVKGNLVPAADVYSSPQRGDAAGQRALGGEADEISLKDLILKLREWYRYLLSKWLIIILAGIIGGLIGLAYAFSKKPIYKAELSFALEDEKSAGSLGGALGLASQFGLDVGGGSNGAFSGDNLLELMKSRTMIQKALLTEVDVNGRKQTLAELYIDFNQLRDQWKNKPELSSVHFLAGAEPEKFTRTQDSLLGIFYKALLAKILVVDKVEKKLSIVAVKVNSENELFSKYFAEVLAGEVSDFYVDTKTKKSVQNLAVLQHQTDSVRRALNSAITGVASSVDANPNANPSRQVLRVPSQRRQVDVQANTAILTELVKNLEISKVSLRKETPLIQVIDRPILPLEKEKFGKLKGLVFGGLIAGFLTTLFLLMRKFLKDVMS
ncbi:MAG: lipopolysaccharide biosynthesis protein [Pyrinomonadaceae bacterium]|nr:lipopolysaccharide biosynthesis protein [Sphingobacteriaceae bacterium]